MIYHFCTVCNHLSFLQLDVHSCSFHISRFSSCIALSFLMLLIGFLSFHCFPSISIMFPSLFPNRFASSEASEPFARSPVQAPRRRPAAGLSLRGEAPSGRRSPHGTVQAAGPVLGTGDERENRRTGVLGLTKAWACLSERTNEVSTFFSVVQSVFAVRKTPISEDADGLIHVYDSRMWVGCGPVNQYSLAVGFFRWKAPAFCPGHDMRPYETSLRSLRLIEWALVLETAVQSIY